VTGTLTTTGTFTANADGTYSDNTMTTGSANVSLGSDCLTVSSVRISCDKVPAAFAPLGWATTCSVTGDKCNCSAVINVVGGVGLLRDGISLNGPYSTSGNTLMTDANYAYCVSGDKLTLTPEFQGIKGAVVLEKQARPARAALRVPAAARWAALVLAEAPVLPEAPALPEALALPAELAHLAERALPAERGPLAARAEAVVAGRAVAVAVAAGVRRAPAAVLAAAAVETPGARVPAARPVARRVSGRATSTPRATPPASGPTAPFAHSSALSAERSTKSSAPTA
jgi:hypothetical protein